MTSKAGRVRIAGGVVTAVVVASTPMVEAFDGFDGVQFMLPAVRDAYVDDPIAMELGDARMIGQFSIVGPSFEVTSEPVYQRFHETKALWGGTTVARIAYSPRVADDSGEVQFAVGRTEDPDRNLFDYANVEKRELAGEHITRSLASIPADWVMYDEPNWGYAGLVDPFELPVSEALREKVHNRLGRSLEDVRAFEEDPEVWRVFVQERQRALVESLKRWSEAVQDAGRKSALNIHPASMESSAVAGFEIATALHVLGDTVDQIGIDPYYTLFVEDPRYAGFLLRLLDDVTPRDLPMMGWIDSVNGLLEKLAIKNPPAESMKPQIASYLANGCDHLAVWAHAYLESLNTRDAYLEVVRWVRQNQSLYRGNPKMMTDTGIFYSNATVASYDFFPKAWSHGTGPFGQYFTALNTYYMLTAASVPVRVISTPLGYESQLAGKLDGLRRLVVIDAVVMTDDEIDAIDSWVRSGGELMIIGDPGRLTEHKQTRDGGLAGRYGIQLTDVQPREGLQFTDAWPTGVNSVHSIALDGSNESVFIDRYQSNRQYALDPDHDERARYYPERWPMHIRSGALEPTTTYEDPQRRDWLARGAAGLESDDNAVVLARYADGEAAVVKTSAGDGRVIHIAPTDWLTRYRDADARQAARTLLHEMSSSQFVLTGPDEQDLASLELVVAERRSGGDRGIVVHLVRHVHDDQGIIPSDGPVENIKLQLPLDSGEVVRSVQGYSPDIDEPTVTFEQNGETVELMFEAVDVYTAVLIWTSPRSGDR
ncbi:hypothetical protein ACERK3_14280 [Phycisphaerales bacterium AB-hyl4]|uniref:Uncharacterized protein n=1 Tax=Natronomicrosphaera hydrolytica TaxID=3242702 RepID=A0ABV4UAW9_9BACT